MILGRIAYLTIAFIKLTTFCLWLFYKRNTKWIPLFRKAKNTRLAARGFLRFSLVSQHPACLDHSIQTRESIWYFLSPEFKISWELLREISTTYHGQKAVLVVLIAWGRLLKIQLQGLRIWNQTTGFVCVSTD